MTVFFSRFVVLACLCAVLPLAPPVEAAHLHGSHSMGKHASSPHSPHPTHKRSSFDGSSMEHRHENKHEDKHEGEHDEHHTHGHQRAGLPPLLRRYRFHGHSNAHYQGQDPHHVDDKVPRSRSAFARSRYHRKPGSHSRRSSVYVPGEHGNTYIVSRAPPGHGKHTYGRRQADETDLASGRIDIMGAVQSPGSTQRLASLTVDSTPVDWMSGQSSGKAFPLNASTTNQTQFIMMPTDDTNADGSANKRVRLATEVFDAGGADMVMYCATYDANPGTPSALLMTPCSDTAQFEVSNDDATGPCADNEDDGSSSNSHQSQIFSYDPFSGVVEPILATDSSSAGGSSSDNPRLCAGAKVRRDTGSSTSGSTTPSSTSTSSTPIPSASKHSQNVTLVYVAGALEVPAPSPSSSVNTTAPATSTTSAHINQAAAVTTTITTTVVTTVMASESATPPKAVESALTSSSSSTTPSLSTSSTTSSRAATTTPTNANESLEVEVIGVAPSTMTGSSSTSASGTATSLPPSSSSSSHSSASPSLNAEAVASSVAKQMPHQGRAIAIASASVV